MLYLRTTTFSFPQAYLSLIVFTASDPGLGRTISRERRVDYPMSNPEKDLGPLRCSPYMEYPATTSRVKTTLMYNRYEILSNSYNELITEEAVTYTLMMDDHWLPELVLLAKKSEYVLIHWRSSRPGCCSKVVLCLVSFVGINDNKDHRWATLKNLR